MHPEVKQDNPGRCPKCGMDLVEVKEKGTGSLDQGHDMSAMDHTEHHRRMAEDFKRRFFIVLPLTIIVLILSPKIQEWFGFSFQKLCPFCPWKYHCAIRWLAFLLVCER